MDIGDALTKINEFCFLPMFSKRVLQVFVQCSESVGVCVWEIRHQTKLNMVSCLASPGGFNMLLGAVRVQAEQAIRWAFLTHLTMDLFQENLFFFLPEL